MGYIVWNGKDYLRQNSNRGGYSLTTSKDKAYVWKSEQKARNICENYKKKYGKLTPLYLHVDCEMAEDLMSFNPIVLDFDILDKAKDLAHISRQLEERKAYLIGQISDADKEVTDIEHAAEFFVLGTVQGYKIYRMLHDTMVRRREIKNELERINYILGTPLKSKDMEDVSKSIAGMDKRKYSPRINKELFGV